MLAENDRNFAVVERVAQDQSLKLCPFRSTTTDEIRILINAGSLPVTIQNSSQERECDYQKHPTPFAGRTFDHEIVELRSKRNRNARRQRPWRRRPDRHRDDIFLADRHPEFCRERLRIDRIVGDIDGRRDLVRVFDLGLGQRRAAVETPVHRFEAAHDVPVRVDLRERAEHVRLIAEIHRAVRIFPVAEHAETFEIRALHVDLLRRVVAAMLAERRRVDFLTDLANLLFDRDLDRQAVAIPPRHERRAEAGKQLRLDHDVLQDLVDCVTQMDRAVRIRRPVVQDERVRTISRVALDRAVAVRLLPLSEHAWLTFGKIRLHREAGLRQVDRVFVILAHATTPTFAA